jgi:hypothetical protein
MRGSLKLWFGQPVFPLVLTMILMNGPIYGQLVIRTGPAATADDDGDVSADLIHPGAWDEEDEVAVAPEGQQPARRVMISVSIDHWIFGNESSQGPDLLNAFLKQKLAAVKREYEGLSSNHLEKLALAGRGDIKHFRDQVEQLKVRYPQNNVDNQTLHVLLAEVQSLRKQLQADQLFGNRSLLSKALHAVVAKENLKPKYSDGALYFAVPNPGLAAGADQVEKMIAKQVKLQDGVAQAAANLRKAAPVEVPVFERDDSYFQTLIQAIAKTFDPDIPLREEQRQPLRQLLRQASRRSEIPLKDPDVILSRLSELPEDDYQKFLDPKQLSCLKTQFAAAKSRLEDRKN